MRPIARPLLTLVLMSLAGCSRTPSGQGPSTADASAFGAPTDLTARLVDNVTVELRWKDNSTVEGGFFVEGYFVSPGATQEFLMIDAVPANTTVYRHVKLMPSTTFVYRVRAIFGNASNEAYVLTGGMAPTQLTLAETPRPTRMPPTTAQKSLRSTLTLAEAAPRDLRATLLPPMGVKLEWKDYARDEDALILEIKTEDVGQERESEFKPSAFLDADSTALDTYALPTSAKVSFRVRAIVYSNASNVAQIKTDTDPELSGSRVRPAPTGKP
jgi:hypothetical protein